MMNVAVLRCPQLARAACRPSRLRATQPLGRPAHKTGAADVDIVEVSAIQAGRQQHRLMARPPGHQLCSSDTAVFSTITVRPALERVFGHHALDQGALLRPAPPGGVSPADLPVANATAGGTAPWAPAAGVMARKTSGLPAMAAGRNPGFLPAVSENPIRVDPSRFWQTVQNTGTDRQ